MSEPAVPFAIGGHGGPTFPQVSQSVSLKQSFLSSYLSVGSFFPGAQPLPHLPQTIGSTLSDSLNFSDDGNATFTYTGSKSAKFLITSTFSFQSPDGSFPLAFLFLINGNPFDLSATIFNATISEFSSMISFTKIIPLSAGDTINFGLQAPLPIKTINCESGTINIVEIL